MINSQDAAEILHVLARYARGIDRLDMALVRDCYWDDATDNHVVFAGGPDEFVAWAEGQLRALYRATGHFMAQSFMKIEGDRAVVETPFRAWHAPADMAGSTFVLNGRYLDLMERRHGIWRILRRDVLPDLCESYSYDPAMQLANSSAANNHQTADPSFEAFTHLHR